MDGKFIHQILKEFQNHQVIEAIKENFANARDFMRHREDE
jgi:hypothetical protein